MPASPRRDVWGSAKCPVSASSGDAGRGGALGSGRCTCSTFFVGSGPFGSTESTVPYWVPSRPTSRACTTERKSPSLVAVNDQWASTGNRYVCSSTNGETSTAHPPAISLRTATPASTAWNVVALAAGDAFGLAHVATAALSAGVATPAATTDPLRAIPAASTSAAASTASTPSGPATNVAAWPVPITTRSVLATAVATRLRSWTAATRWNVSSVSS